ncbi:MAG: mycothiol synthase, partial [Saccharothrix sp.]|nr:mycothiol synthase [Saccharothrix sp.]
MELIWTEERSPEQADEVSGLLGAAEAADGVAPVGEAVV